jgi:hypothetical protein
LREIDTWSHTGDEAETEKENRGYGNGAQRPLENVVQGGSAKEAERYQEEEENAVAIDKAQRSLPNEKKLKGRRGEDQGDDGPAIPQKERSHQEQERGGEERPPRSENETDQEQTAKRDAYSADQPPAGA